MKNVYKNKPYEFGFWCDSLPEIELHDVNINKNISFIDACKKFKQLVKHNVNSIPLNNTIFTLSGGLDTTCIVASLNHDTQYNTAVLLDKNEDWFDNIYSYQASRFYNTNHLVVHATFDIEDLMYEMLEYDNKRINSGDLFAYWYLKNISKYCDNIVGGEGVEFILPGFECFDEMHYYAMSNGDYDINLAKQCLNDTFGSESYKLSFDVIKIAKLKNKKLNYLNLYLDHLNWYTKNKKYTNNNIDYVNAFLYGRKFHMKNLLLDRISSFSKKFNLTYYTPYLNQNIIDFCDSLPMEYKWCLGYIKFLMFSSFKNDLPGDIINRRKQGFLPYDMWYKSNQDVFDNLMKKLDIKRTDNFFKDYTLLAYKLGQKLKC